MRWQNKTKQMNVSVDVDVTDWLFCVLMYMCIDTTVKFVDFICSNESESICWQL